MRQKRKHYRTSFVILIKKNRVGTLFVGVQAAKRSGSGYIFVYLG